MSEHYTLQDWINTLALNSKDFRQRFLHDPKEALESQLGLSVPQEVSVQVHEQTATTLHFVLPASAETVSAS